MPDVFNRNHTKLTQIQYSQIEDIKTKAQSIWDALDNYLPEQTPTKKGRMIDRGRQELEIAVMLITKGLAMPDPKKNDSELPLG